MTNKKSGIKIILESNPDLLLIDLFIRGILLIIQCIIFSLFHDRDVEIPISALIAIHGITLLIYLYLIKRRSVGIKKYITMRSRSFRPIKSIKQIKITPAEDNGRFLVFSLLCSLFIGASFALSHGINIDEKMKIPSVVISTFTSILVSLVILRIYKAYFISNKVDQFEINNTVSSAKQLKEFQEFLENKEDEEDDLHFKNDDWIIEIDKKIKEYRVRTETFLIESVFLGALTFSAFLTIVGPEGAEAMSNIDFRSQLDTIFEQIKQLNLTELFGDKHNIDHLYILIACGSIICSVFYIAVLIKRYPIIRNIESLAASAEKAKIWNKREEDMVLLESQAEVKDDIQKEVVENIIGKRLKYSNSIQIKLAECEEKSVEIESKIKLISMLRIIGLYIFFSVLFIGSLIIHPVLWVILISILFYAILTAKIINIDFGKNNFINWLKSRLVRKAD